MIYNRDFLRKICALTMVFLYHGFACDVMADTGNSISLHANIATVSERQSGISNAVKIKEIEASRMSDKTTETETVPICPEGWYVSKCGNYRVGFNWLKSAILPDPEHPQTDEVSNMQTKNYHMADTDMLSLFAKMRTFFGHENTVLYYYDDNNNRILATPSDITKDREAILNNLCHPSTAVIKCATCPNNAHVDASTVGLDDNNLTVQGTWNFYTIADCYMQEFEDSTGSYFFVPESIETLENIDATEAEKCYYANTNPEAMSALSGDEIGVFIPGLNTDNTVKETTLVIPSVKKTIK